MKKFNIPGYPTVLMLNSDGEEIDRIVGFDGDRDKYLATIKDYSEGRNTLADFKKRIVQTPTDVALNHNLAKKLLYRGEPAEARIYFQKVLELDSQNQFGFYDEASYRLATFAASEGNIAPMEKFFKNYSGDDYMSGAVSRLIRHYQKAEQPQKVMQVFDRALSKLSDNPSMLNRYSWFVFENEVRERYDHAITMAQKAVEIAPDADHIWDTLAQLQFANGNTEAAITAIKKAIEINGEEESYQKLLEKYQSAPAGKKAA